MGRHRRRHALHGPDTDSTGWHDRKRRYRRANQTRQTLEAAGASLDDVVQVQIFLDAKEDFQAVNDIYRTIFSRPYPNRSTVVAGLVVKGSKIEIVVHAALDKRTA